jgi:hypothetical protein
LFWFETENEKYSRESGFPVFLSDQEEYTIYGFPAIDNQVSLD